MVARAPDESECLPLQDRATVPPHELTRGDRRSTKQQTLMPQKLPSNGVQSRQLQHLGGTMDSDRREWSRRESLQCLSSAAGDVLEALQCSAHRSASLHGCTQDVAERARRYTQQLPSIHYLMYLMSLNDLDNDPTNIKLSPGGPARRCPRPASISYHTDYT